MCILPNFEMGVINYGKQWELTTQVTQKRRVENSKKFIAKKKKKNLQVIMLMYYEILGQ